MLTHATADAFAKEWVTAWNRNDLDTVLAHYVDDCEFTSPFVRELMDIPDGTLNGKAALREYWELALKGVSELHFEVLETFVGADSIIIHYIGVQRRRGAQLFFFNNQRLVTKAIAHYNTL